MGFLAGLPSEFKTAKSQILSSFEITSLQYVSVGCCAQRVLHPISRRIYMLQKKEGKMMLGVGTITIILGGGTITKEETLMLRGGTVTMMLGGGTITKEETVTLFRPTAMNQDI